MPRRKVFFSFHFDNDCMRTQQIRNIGAIEGEQPVSPNDWERIKKSGDTAIKNWIDTHLKYKDCLIVLVGSETANRPWVRYEISKAWDDGKGVFGIYIHSIKCPRKGICMPGPNPFDGISLNNGSKLSSLVTCRNPHPADAYNDIANNIETWIEDAIRTKRKTG